MYEALISLRLGGRVDRGHTSPALAAHTVAQHSAQALNILLHLKPDASPCLIRAVLWHDCAERVTGDIPAPAKRAHPTYRAECKRIEERFNSTHTELAIALSGLSDEDVEWLRAVDACELLLEGIDQHLMGNQLAWLIVERALGYLKKNESTPEAVLMFASRMASGEYEEFMRRTV